MLYKYVLVYISYKYFIGYFYISLYFIIQPNKQNLKILKDSKTLLVFQTEYISTKETENMP